MKITKTKEENRTAYLTVELEQPEMEQYLDFAYKGMVNQVEIPGFRKGNAPKEVLEQHVGRPKMIEQVKKEFLPMICSQAIKDQQLQIAAQPMVKITKEDPLAFELVLALKPLVEIADYRSIRLQPQPMVVTDKDVDEVLEGLRHQSASMQEVDRPVEQGDVLTINIEGIVMESPFIRGNGSKFTVNPDFPPEIPGLWEHFIGMKKNEEKEFKHKLPDTYSNKLVAGKEVTFKTKVLGINREVLPAMDDAFAASLAPDMKTLDELKKRITENMKLDYEQKSRNQFEEKLIDIVVGQSKLEYPPMLVDSEADYLFQEGLQQLQGSCKSKEEYENKLKQMPMDQVRQRYHEMAEKRVRWNLVMEEIEQKERIEAGDEEIDAEIESMTQGLFGKEREEQQQFLNEPMNRENVRGMVMMRKVLGLLAQIATQTESPTASSSENPASEATAAGEEAAEPAKKSRKKSEKEAEK